MEFSGTFTISKKEVTKFTSRVEMTKKQLPILVLTAVGMVAGNFMLRTQVPSPGLLLSVLCSLAGGALVFGIAYGGVRYSIAKAAAQAYDGGYRVAFQQDILINALGVTCTTEEETDHVGFDALTVEECKEAFYIFIAQQSAWIVPKNQLKNGVEDEALIRKIFTTMTEKEHLNLRKTKA
ncbi:MAG: YcxB family protein [Oscillospiraceae bacterium]